MKPEEKAIQEQPQDEFSDLIDIIHEILTGIALYHDKLHRENPKKLKKTAFDARTIPAISIKDYLIRFARYIDPRIDKTDLILTMLLVDKYILCANIDITSCNIHRLLSVSLMLNIKHYSDRFHTNEYFAALAGFTLKEMNLLERDFLVTIDFTLGLGLAEYDTYEKEFNIKLRDKHRERLEKKSEISKGYYTFLSSPQPSARKESESEERKSFDFS